MSTEVVAKQQATDHSAVPSENPLLDVSLPHSCLGALISAGGDMCKSGLQSGSFPLYDQVKAEHVVPGIKQLLSGESDLPEA